MKKIHIIGLIALVGLISLVGNRAIAQAPGTTPVKVSHETQVMNGRKYYVHIVETGQTVYSISKAYKVNSYDAVTHVDIHFLHAGDTVWLPFRGQFSASEETMEADKQAAAQKQTEQKKRPADEKKDSKQQAQSSPKDPVSTTSTAPAVRSVGDAIRISVLMPLHLNEIDEISTTKFDIEQRGKKSYRQFEFIEFYEGILLALEQLPSLGVNARVELNVVDVSDNSAQNVEKVFQSHNVAQSDVVIALLFRDAFTKAAELSRQAGVYIVNPMSTRSEICADNPYMVKIQPSMESQVRTMLDNMKAERPDGHLYIIHGGTGEKPLLTEIKRQLSERGDIKYTLFNWSQSNKLTSTLKSSPNCNVLSIYDQPADQMRVYVSNLLNRLAAIKSNSPTLYTLSDWTRDYSDIDFAQLQLLNYHTFSSNWDLSNNTHVDFLTHFRERFGSEPTSTLAATGYDLTAYIVYGLSLRNNRFWNEPGVSLAGLIHPFRLGRRQAGLENEQPQLYRMEDLHFVPAK